ncbi:two-component system, response regulator YesN [Paenibacillus catalpae]|uniref:Two-component system, response regulator YesN n=1 Tax=Paenibacillus catalpae TaxID=1045775 RepID=A0A1I1SSJ2_9BACL|nr:response regulator [Paenibacillus catalpae]SFD49407.1 two-component system, response regulator YesN [Paenibacillus catalpae]
MKLLIVDDEEHLVESIAAIQAWETIGITKVLSAYSGKQALLVMEAEAADIVITDIRMPGMNGIDLIREIKNSWPETECLLLTGHAEFDYAQQGLKNKASHYLLKPVKDEELLAAVREAADYLQREQERKLAYLHSQSMIHLNLPVLRSNLLNNLIQGRALQEKKLQEQFRLYGISIDMEYPVSLILIRLEDRGRRYEPSDMSILGYAVSNIAEELLLHNRYNYWNCEDLYGHLLFAVQPQNHNPEQSHLFDELGDQMKRTVNALLHLTITVILSPPGSLPSQSEEMYQRCLATIRSQVDQEGDYTVRLGADNVRPASHVVASLYTPPLLPHLLEAGKWEAANKKLQEVFLEWNEKYSGSNEHLSEIYYSLKSAFSYFVHKNGGLLADYRLQESREVKSLGDLEYWATTMLSKLREQLNTELSDSRHSIVARVHQYVQDHLSEDVSLQAIADHVYMHPTHLSKVFKRETGENISEYLLRLRMEKAVFLLKDSRYKVYEIASILGYKNPTYFIKVFKEQLGVTPQEFRE